MSAPVGADALLGTWDVDLRAHPGAPADLKSLVVSAVLANTLTGSFCDTEISDGRINADRGAVRIASVTADGSGPYHHSAVLREGRLEGLTRSLGRRFLAWCTPR